jgi:hypothetical protein
MSREYAYDIREDDCDDTTRVREGGAVRKGREEKRR